MSAFECDVSVVNSLVMNDPRNHDHFPTLFFDFLMK